MTDLVKSFEAEPATARPLWRVNSYQTARVGDRVYLFKQGSDPRGVFGVGEIVEAPSLRPDPTDIEGGLTNRARIRFDKLVDPSREFLLGFRSIESFVPEVLVNAQASGNSVPDAVAAELEKQLGPLLSPEPPLNSKHADDGTFDPESLADERERAFRAIRLRRGQAAFRSALMEAYGRRCAITGCAVEDVLEAAHITPYVGSLTNHVSNGLLLRADLHTLFDCGLLAIDPKTRRFVVADALAGSSYAKVNGKALRPPNDAAAGPSRRNLEARFARFNAARQSDKNSGMST